MALRLWAAMVVFIGSYFPLSLILLAQDFDFTFLSKDLCIEFWGGAKKCVLPFQNPHISVFIFAICSVSFVLSTVVLKYVKVKRQVKVLKVKPIPAEVINYTLPYVVAFMGVGYADQSRFVGMVIFLVWMFWITYKSGQIILNPMLIVLGWRLYEVTYSHDLGSKELTGVALSDGELAVGELARYGFVQDIMIIRSSVPNGGGNGKFR